MQDPMKNHTLRYVGITHETARVAIRERFVLSKIAREQLRDSIMDRFSVRGVLVLSTCNRTEIYFESDRVAPNKIRDHLISFVDNGGTEPSVSSAFILTDDSLESASFLLEVANGLKSAVVGDKQIISQVKEAYHAALRRGDQGSVLERACQAVFRSHKRIANESLYRSGSTSTAYRALKLVQHHYGSETLARKKLLVVGAGEIAKDVLSYTSKFSFGQVFVSNRTELKARQLASQFNAEVCPWPTVAANTLEEFDIIIAAVGNRRHLIKEAVNDSRERIYIDLAIPVNIAPALDSTSCKLYNIDDIAGPIHQVIKQQEKALAEARQIIGEELDVFTQWLERGETRSFLRAYKEKAKQVILDSFPLRMKSNLPAGQLEQLAESLANKMIKRPAVALNRIGGLEAYRTIPPSHTHLQ